MKNYIPKVGVGTACCRGVARGLTMRSCKINSAAVDYGRGSSKRN